MPSLFNRIFKGKKEEKRGFLDLALNGFGGTGVVVNPETALTFSAVYAAIRVISETIAQLPLNYYKKTDKGREVYTDSPLFTLVNSEPNNLMSKYTFFETFVNTLLVYGNAYAFIERGQRGIPTSLKLIHPDDVTPDLIDDNLIYSVKGLDGNISSSDMIHVLDMSFDGITGQSRISKAKNNIALGLAAQKYGLEFFESSCKTSGVLMHPATLGSDALQTLRESWRKTFHTGVGGKFETAILEEGMQYKPIQLKPDEAQFLATRKFSILEIARIFRVPAHKLASLESATFSNISHQTIEFLTDTINPIAIKIEQELNRKLIFEDEKGRSYFEHNTNGLLRGDAKTRAEYYAKLFGIGAITQNEIRRRENMNDIDGGDVLFVPMNMINSKKAADEKQE